MRKLPKNETPFKTSADQAAIVGNAVESAKLVRAHIVTRRKMTAEMLEALLALWAREAIPIEPSVNRRDRMKLTRIQIAGAMLATLQLVPKAFDTAAPKDAEVLLNRRSS